MLRVLDAIQTPLKVALQRKSVLYKNEDIGTSC